MRYLATKVYKGKWIARQPDSQTEIDSQTDKKMNGQAHEHTAIQPDRQKDRQINRETGRKTARNKRKQKKTDGEKRNINSQKIN